MALCFFKLRYPIYIRLKTALLLIFQNTQKQMNPNCLELFLQTQETKQKKPLFLKKR